MTGISITIGLRDEKASHDLRALLVRMDDRRPFYAAVGERLLAATQDRFQKETGPDGTPWKPLRPRTIRAREAKGQTPITILRSNAKGKIGSSLAGSINYDATPDEVRIGSPVVYAAIHQLGGVINKPERKATIHLVGRRFAKAGVANRATEVTIPAHKITIPARPFIGISTTDEAGILEDAEDWLTR